MIIYGTNVTANVHLNKQGVDVESTNLGDCQFLAFAIIGPKRLLGPGITKARNWKSTSIVNNISIASYMCNRLIDLVGRVFANALGDLGSIPGRVIPKTLKMVLDTPLLNTQRYKVHIKGKVEQFREKSSALPYTSV